MVILNRKKRLQYALKLEHEKQLNQKKKDCSVL